MALDLRLGPSMRIAKFLTISIALLASGSAFAVSPPAGAENALVLHSTLSDFDGRSASIDSAVSDVKIGRAHV